MTAYEYGFGHLRWQGESFRNDLIILPGGQIISPWRREHGHRLEIGDLTEVIAAAPRVLIIGAGATGRMKVDDHVLSELAAQGIDAEAMPTAKALKRYIDVSERKAAAAALHLTC